jgi:23S rRNA (cytidine1920-2'-O)/16S rRNA (cytidine1409-2'-O)-methyltransferase
VQNLVENPESNIGSSSATNACTLCTELDAGTSVVSKYFLLRQVVVKVRLDKLLFERGMAQSRERAQALILAGKVLVDDQKIEKAGEAVDADAEIRLLGEDLRYVGRGGLKLEKALQHWKIDLTGKTCMDIGASTGGFTDCMLQHGASRVIAVDTGRGQMDFRLRQDTRVRLLENTNARYLTQGQVGEEIDFVAIDVSFISATLVLPAVIEAAFPEHVKAHELVVLVKPQFEAGREHVGKGGIVRDETAQLAAVEKVRACLASLGCNRIDVIDSPILGTEGNREFLVHADK